MLRDKDKKNLKIACIIPTRNGGTDIIRLIGSLERQITKPDIYIVDSDSNDGTYEWLSEKNLKLCKIRVDEFNHGGTRQLIINQNPDYDLYIFLTQDAYLEADDSIHHLILPFEDPSVGAVCGRQLPHHNANLFAKHARFYNYPPGIRIKSLADAPVLGLKTPFISNSFAAYRGDALGKVGGFPEHVIFAEDMYVAAKMLLKGWKIVYTSNACCRHSHNYNIVQEFCRYFDMGVFHARERWIRENFGGAGGEGFNFIMSELKFLGLRRLNLWPSSIMRNLFKLLGYKIGQKEEMISKRFKKKLGMYKGYWDSPCSFRSKIL